MFLLMLRLEQLILETQSCELKEFISCLENLNKKAIIKYVDNKMGDVSSTWRIQKF